MHFVLNLQLYDTRVTNIRIFTFHSEWSQEENHGWKRYESSWQPDTGFSNNPLEYNLPMRTFGDSDYHSATMMLDLHTEDFNRECAQGMDVFNVNTFHNQSYRFCNKNNNL